MNPPEPGTTGRTLTELSASHRGQVEVGGAPYPAYGDYDTYGAQGVISPDRRVCVVGTVLHPEYGVILIVRETVVENAPDTLSLPEPNPEQGRGAFRQPRTQEWEGGAARATPPGEPAAPTGPLSQEERIYQLEQQIEELRRRAEPRHDTPAGPSGTTCYCCGQPAYRSCTRCGNFFCPAHGGDGLISEGRGRNASIVTRGLCDDCTPNQSLKQFQRGLGLVVGLIGILLTVLFMCAIGMPGCQEPSKRRQTGSRQPSPAQLGKPPRSWPASGPSHSARPEAPSEHLAPTEASGVA
jgi:hypothetical protein